MARPTFRPARWAIVVAVAGIFALAAPPAFAQGGPVVLMGIDAEDGGPFGHGPPATYTNLVNNIQAQITKPALNPLLVIGCKFGTDTGDFWTAVFPTHTCVEGEAAIRTVNFTLFRMIAVVSDEINTPFGGLICSGTDNEDKAIDDRAADIATHVNSGGGLLGFSSDCPNPLAYVKSAATVTVSFPPQYANIDPTTEGLLVGVNDTLDVCCWHDVYTSFPSFLSVLAFRGGTSEAAAIGGKKVVIPLKATPTTLSLSPKTSENPVGGQHTVQATVQDELGNNMQGVLVTFNVNGASGSLSGTDTTNSNGVATFMYTGPAFPGVDSILACVEQAPGDGTCHPVDLPADTAEKTWILPVSSPNCAVDMNKETGGGQITAKNDDRFSFGGNAQVSPTGEPTGEQEAQDQGPVEQFIYHGKVVVVVCEFDPVSKTGSATIFTESSTTSSITGLARIDVKDLGEPGSGATDTYRFRLSGYDTNEQPLKSGNIQIHKG